MHVTMVTAPSSPLRIVLGGDEAGFEYKAALLADLSKDPRVKLLHDIGPFTRTDTTAYPHYAVAAARMVRFSPSFCLRFLRCWFCVLHFALEGWG